MAAAEEGHIYHLGLQPSQISNPTAKYCKLLRGHAMEWLSCEQASVGGSLVSVQAAAASQACRNGSTCCMTWATQTN